MNFSNILFSPFSFLLPEKTPEGDHLSYNSIIKISFQLKIFKRDIIFDHCEYFSKPGMEFFMRIIKLFTAVLPLAACLALSASPAEELNRLLQDNYRRHDLTPVKRTTDEIFLRRTMLNINGKLPTAEEVRSFAADPSPDKREKLIQKLLDSPGFADVSAWRFADMFRIKSEFPINLWPNAVQAYHRFFRDAVIQNRPWDALCRELITASGSNFRVPAANFFRASADRSPEGLAKAAALALMGIRTEKLPEDDRKAFAAFFSRISFKSTDEWKEEIVYLNPAAAVIHPRTPDGTSFTIKVPETDPRTVFADWLLADDNPFFARAFVNRTWHWLFGRGLVEPADDMPLPRNFWQKTFSVFSGSSTDEGNEKILNFLAEEFRKNRYDIKKLFALIMSSCAYNADWKTIPAEQEKAEKFSERHIDKALIWCYNKRVFIIK